MVRRNRSFYPPKNNEPGHANGSKRRNRSPGNGFHDSPDLENGRAIRASGIKPKIFRFHDVAKTALEDSRREELKKKLLDGLEEVDLERYRKKKEDVGAVLACRTCLPRYMTYLLWLSCSVLSFRVLPCPFLSLPVLACPACPALPYLPCHPWLKPPSSRPILTRPFHHSSKKSRTKKCAPSTKTKMHA